MKSTVQIAMRVNRKVFDFAVIALAILISVYGQASSAATTAVVDDSATVVLDGTPQMAWRSLSPKKNDNVIIGRTRVNVRLATAPWLGKTGKIYMVLPAQYLTSTKVNWRSRGTLLEGQLSAGGRTLVYAGVIRESRIEDVLEINIEADGTQARGIQRLRFHFEIDVD